ncbi:MAG: DNA adenine methylase [Lachnospiraceae bacterium]|nr:DNA adenine methylase [Lachnospiraceae bacterium]
MNSVLKYPGSKWNIADNIISLLPEHHTYVEPFFGSGAVFFNKKPSDIELINDLDLNVVNLFRCIKEDSGKLSALIAATPFSRYEYEETYCNAVPDEPYEKALVFLIRCWMGHGYRTNGNKVGWKNDVVGREKMYALWNWYRLPEWVAQIAERLRMVQIENRPALEVIERFNYDNVFMYLDPPYVLSTRSGKQYNHEMSDSEHEEFLQQIINSKAKIMVSGYDNDMYNDYLGSWGKFSFDAKAEYGRARKECIWLNYHCKRQLSLFDI